MLCMLSARMLLLPDTVKTLSFAASMATLQAMEVYTAEE
jgi:hypothetical protein